MIVLQFEFLLLVPELPISKRSCSEAPVCFHGPELNRLILGYVSFLKFGLLCSWFSSFSIYVFLDVSSPYLHFPGGFSAD